MSISNLLTNKNTYTDVKCDSINVNSLKVERYSGTNTDDSSPILLPSEASGFGLYEGIWTQAGAVAPDSLITLSITLPAGWNDEGQRPMITYVSINGQEFCNLKQVVGNQLDFNIWNASPSVVAVNVTRIIRILLV